MREVPVTTRGAPDQTQVAALTPTLQMLRLLDDVLEWGMEHSPPRAVNDIVTQDEYTHDVIVRYDERCWLAFDTT
jgi:hypothetical protein